jgi:hypothetical protein
VHARRGDRGESTLEKRLGGSVRNLLTRGCRSLLQVVDEFVVMFRVEMAVAIEHHGHARVSGSDGYLFVMARGLLC